MNTPRRPSRRDLADALLVVTLAPRCAACSAPLRCPTRGPVCSSCWDAVRTLQPPLCVTCGGTLPSWRALGERSQCALCRRQPPEIHAARAAGEYEGVLREIIHAFKYEGRRSLAGPLGRLMREAGADLLSDTDCVIPVPLHTWRRITRGFNQASDLARQLELPLVRALRRSRRTASQTGLTAAARHRNVSRAFRLSPFLSRAQADRFIQDRIVALVDDVRTTGATLDACARVLRAAGARQVRALTVAIATPPERSASTVLP